MGNWIETLLKKLGELWPFVKLEPFEEGITVTYWPNLGKRWPARTTQKRIGPGTHFLLWYYMEVLKESTVPQVMDLLSQTIVLKDGSVVSFSVNIEYSITDVDLNLTKVHAFERSLEAASRIHLARRVRALDNLPALIAEQDGLEKSLKGTLTTRAKRWGAEINEVGFTDLMPSTAFRFLGDSPFAH